MNEKEFCQEAGVAFTNSRSTTTIRQRFRALLEADSEQQKKCFILYVTIDETWTHYYTTEYNRDTAEWNKR